MDDMVAFECGRVAFENWRDEIEPDGWGKGLAWRDLHPNTQQVWIDLAKDILNEFGTYDPRLT